LLIAIFRNYISPYYYGLTTLHFIF